MNVNKSIGCNVTECKYHAKTDSYCSLNHIDVVKHTGTAGTATTVECTDCGSFVSENK